MSNVLKYINAAGLLLAAAESITPEIQRLAADVKAAIDGKEPTDEMWSGLHAIQDRNTATLNAPMDGED